jgi:hypothetical protein
VYDMSKPALFEGQQYPYPGMGNNPAVGVDPDGEIFFLFF